MDGSTYRHLLGKINKNCPIPHHNFPSHNLVSLETLCEVSENLNCEALDNDPKFLGSFPCYQPFPYTAQGNSVLFCGSGFIDNATELVKKKRSWERKLKGLKLPNIDSGIKDIKEVRQNKPVKLSRSLNTYIQHFYSDPEPMFSGNYNWLYTGGCLSLDEEFDGATLVNADFFTTQSGFNIIKLNESLNKVRYKSFCHLKASSPVFQITSKAQQENLLICVRQKNYVTVFGTKRMVDDVHPVKLWRKKVLGSKLLTCTDIKDGCEEIILSDSSCDAHVFHVERKIKISGHCGKKIAPDYNRDSWSQVAFGELGIYWASKNCFAILDARVFHKNKLQYYPTSETNNCEEICSFLQSPKDSKYVYLGTTHHILQLDLRNGKPVQRWTHLMKNPPQFMTVMKVDRNKEVLVLQSPMVDEVSGIVNESTVDGNNFTSRSLPCLLRNAKESLKLAHFQGLCLNPFIVKRVNFAVTGMQGLESGQGDFILFTTNSGGDIFLSKIKKKTSRHFLADDDEQEVMATMRMYESHCDNFPIGNFKNSRPELVDLSHLLKGGDTHLFLSAAGLGVIDRREAPFDVCYDPVVKGLKQPETKAKKPKQKEPEIYWSFREMYSPESLIFFKDVLARRILKVWGHGQLLEEPESNFSPISVDHKVREWMDKC